MPYKQTVLARLGTLGKPLAFMLVFTFCMSGLNRDLPRGLPYPLFLLAGLLPWNFISSSITASGPSIVNSQNLVTKVYFPRLIIPMGAVIASLLDFTICGVLLMGLLTFYQALPGGYDFWRSP